MKTILSVLAVAFVCLASFTVIEYHVNKATAEVKQIDGVYVFIGSNPVKPYESLGDFKIIWTDGTYVDMSENAVKQAKRKYSSTEGVIFHFSTITMVTTAEAIKFKD